MRRSVCERFLGITFLRRFVRRFARQQDGAAAVEFALVSIPFITLLFAIMETGMVFFADQVLETAVGDSARNILTGQAQTQSFDQTAFKNSICAKLTVLFDCQGGVYVDVKKFTNFSSVTMASPLDSNGNFVNNFTYNAGGPGDIVVVRVFYQWPLYLSFFGFSLQNMSGGKRLLVVTSAFRNEPYAN